MACGVCGGPRFLCGGCPRGAPNGVLSSASRVVATVFVYGTLLRGEGNHRLLERATFLREACTRAEFSFHTLGGFPGLVPFSASSGDPMPEGNGPQSVVGELYEVDARTLDELDALEGHPRFYERTEIVLADGTKASTYLLPSYYATRPVIPSGSWREHRKALSEHHDARRPQV